MTPQVQPEAIAGVVIITGARLTDDRGSFRKVITMADTAICNNVEQVATASNHVAGTLRGLHYQAAPFDEAKTVWCISGQVYDVLVDLRPGEPTYGHWAVVHLDSETPTAVHVPPGVAHGYQTLVDETTLGYLISSSYAPHRQRTLAYDDQTVGVSWPVPVSSISEGDRLGARWPPES